jgi:hypothetical protein
MKFLFGGLASSRCTVHFGNLRFLTRSAQYDPFTVRLLKLPSTGGGANAIRLFRRLLPAGRDLVNPH